MRKSEKRARGEARHAKALEESRQSGLAALRGDQERRRQRQEEAIKEARRKQTSSEATKKIAESTEGFNRLGEAAKEMAKNLNPMNEAIRKTNEDLGNLAALNQMDETLRKRKANENPVALSSTKEN